MVLSRFFCCFAPSEEVGTPRTNGTDQELEPESASPPSAASCSTPAGPYKFVFDKDDADRVTGLNNSCRWQGHFCPDQFRNQEAPYSQAHSLFPLN